MTAYPEIRDEDRDSLYSLPLSMLPLETAGLREARLIKNARLEGVIELYSGKDTGSGQIRVDQLWKIFEFDKSRANDVKILKALSVVPSYDVYSLRVELRRLGIPVDEHEYLQLSRTKCEELTKYMVVFTKPLIEFVYGSENVKAVGDYRSLIRMFSSPDIDAARQNLRKLAKHLKIEIEDLPEFLQDYGDNYLSLSYYQQCLDENMPALEQFFQSIQEIKANEYLRKDSTSMDICSQVEDKLGNTVAEVNGMMELYKKTTLEMWENLSASEFGTVRQLIEAYRTRIGGALCAITVKMRAWTDRFPEPEIGSLSRRVEFIITDLRWGIDRIEPIGYKETGSATGAASMGYG